MEKEILGMRAKPRWLLNLGGLVQFNPDGVLEKIQDSIIVKDLEVSRTEKESYLLFKYGRLKLNTAKKESLKFEKNIPYYSGQFQMNQKLYICGGTAFIKGQQQYLASLYSIDYKGKCVERDSMQSYRGFLSLTGFSPYLLALGG